MYVRTYLRSGRTCLRAFVRTGGSRTGVALGFPVLGLGSSGLRSFNRSIYRSLCTSKRNGSFEYLTNAKISLGGQSPPRPPHVVRSGIRRRIVRSSSDRATNAQADDERPVRRRGGIWGGFAPPVKFDLVMYSNWPLTG